MQGVWEDEEQSKDVETTLYLLVSLVLLVFLVSLTLYPPAPLQGGYFSTINSTRRFRAQALGVEPDKAGRSVPKLRVESISGSTP